MLIKKQFPDREQFKKLSENSNVIPVAVEILADTETPVSLLRKIYAQKGPAFLLESVEGGERWGRYSFLSTSPRCHVRVFADHVAIEKNGTVEKKPHRGDPLALLKTFMAQYRPAQVSGLPRFWGGLVGFLTYEMVSFFEKIPSRLPAQKPIAHFVLPDELLIFDNIQHTLIVVALAFTAEEADLDEVYDQAGQKIDALMAKMNQTVTDISPRAGEAGFELNAVLAEDNFRANVSKVKEYIMAGDVIQTVISQPFVCTPSPDLWTLYRAQRFVNPSPYLYFLHLDDLALVGSSPETMVRLENGIATLRPIAGTRPRGKTEQEDRNMADELLSDEKERAEHLMLVDLGRNDLGRVAETGTVQVTELMVVERYSHVMHLVSNIRCDIKPAHDAWDLLKASFPAGTLSGAPKVRAMEIIAELEKGPRGPYGGAVGYVSFSGNMDMAITIRTALIEGGHLTVQAGAGIVADSDPESERIETCNKARAIQRALELMKY